MTMLLAQGLPAQPPPDLNDLFVRVLGQLTDTALPDVLLMGKYLWSAIATIMLTYWGLRLAFGQGGGYGELLEKVLFLMLPYTILHYYDKPIVGSLTFPQLIAAQGVWLQDVFLKNSVTNVFTEYMSVLTVIWKQLYQDWQDLNILWALAKAPERLFTMYAMALLAGVTLLMVGLVWVITTAQVLLAILVIAIYVLLGPLFIPFYPVKAPVFGEFFWNWLRSVLKYSLYSAVAGAMLAVFSGVGIAYLRMVKDALLRPDGFSTITEFFSWTLITMIFFTVGLLATLKVDEIAGSLVSGGGPSTGGMLVGAATTAASAGSAIAARGGAAALKGK